MPYSEDDMNQLYEQSISSIGSLANEIEEWKRDLEEEKRIVNHLRSEINHYRKRNSELVSILDDYVTDWEEIDYKRQQGVEE